MKYFLFILFTFPLFTQSINNSKSAQEDVIENSKTVKTEDSSKSDLKHDSKDNMNLSQVEIRMKRKWETSLGYAEGNPDFSPTPGIMNLNIQYNWKSRFSIGYTHLHERSYSNELNDGLGILGYIVTSKTKNTLDVGLLNFRIYLFEKFPLYLTGGWGRDWIGRDNVTDTRYGFITSRNRFQSSPLIRESISTPGEYKFYGLGFQWVFQNGFFIGLEYTRMYSRYKNKSNTLVLDRNYTLEGYLVEDFIFNSGYIGEIDTGFKNIKLGYSYLF